MKLLRIALIAAASAATLVTATGCSMARNDSSIGDVVDDSWITTKIKSKFAENTTVSAMALNVQTVKGVVQLSGFAKSAEEKMLAETLARDTKGVKSVRNDVIVRAG